MGEAVTIDLNRMRGGYAAIARQDWDEVQALYDRQIEWVDPPQVPGALPSVDGQGRPARPPPLVPGPEQRVRGGRAGPGLSRGSAQGEAAVRARMFAAPATGEAPSPLGHPASEPLVVRGRPIANAGVQVGIVRATRRPLRTCRLRTWDEYS